MAHSAMFTTGSLAVLASALLGASTVPGAAATLATGRTAAGTSVSAEHGTVYIVGDSSLDGTGDTGGKVEATLAGLLGTRVVNNAVGGAGMKGVQGQFACSSDSTCVWSIVNGGMNGFEGVRMEDVVDRELAAGRRVIINGYPAMADSGAREWLNEFMDDYKGIAAARCNVFLLDYRTHPLMDVNDPASRKYRADDNDHPSPLAGVEFAKSISAIVLANPDGDCGAADAAGTAGAVGGAGPTTYRVVSDQGGTCAGVGMAPITTAAECGTAAEAVGNSDTTPSVTTANGRPEGCYKKGDSGNLYFASSAGNAGNGASGTRWPLCKLAPGTTKAPATTKVPEGAGADQLCGTQLQATEARVAALQKQVAALNAKLAASECKARHRE